MLCNNVNAVIEGICVQCKCASFASPMFFFRPYVASVIHAGTRRWWRWWGATGPSATLPKRSSRPSSRPWVGHEIHTVQWGALSRLLSTHCIVLFRYHKSGSTKLNAWWQCTPHTAYFKPHKNLVCIYTTYCYLIFTQCTCIFIEPLAK
jgi:hypothetical protein